jgi:hypothetical protein
MTETSPKRVSLLSKASTGGDIADSGLTFQDYYILSQIPLWLQNDGFMSLKQESIEDIEIKFFHPFNQSSKIAIQAKTNNITPNNFSEIVTRFHQIDLGTPHTFHEFRLIANDFSKGLKPVINGKKRLDGNDGFYNLTEVVMQNSVQDFIDRVKALGLNDEITNFVLEHVWFETLPLNHESSLALFGLRLSGIETWGIFPEIPDVFNNLLSLLKLKRSQTIHRREIEQIIKAHIAPNTIDLEHPVNIYTSINGSMESSNTLCFDLQNLSLNSRNHPLTLQDWNSFVEELIRTRQWIEDNRGTKIIQLSGSRNLSHSFAIGHVFSRVSEFSFRVAYREQEWLSSNYHDDTTPAYSMSDTLYEGTGDSLIVVIGIYPNNDIESDVYDYLTNHKIKSPILSIIGNQAIDSDKHANLVATQVKQVIKKALTETQTQSINLFYAGPSPLALFLGHQLNATADIQCYEWDKNNRCYIPSCKLPQI